MGGSQQRKEDGSWQMRALRGGPARRRGWRWLRPLLPRLLSAAPIVAATPTPAPAVHEVDWRTNPLDLNLAGLQRRAPPLPVSARQGSTRAGHRQRPVHRRLFDLCRRSPRRSNPRGLVTIEMRPGEEHYAASLSHYVQSEAYDRSWSDSFLVISADHAEASP